MNFQRCDLIAQEYSKSTTNDYKIQLYLLLFMFSFCVSLCPLNSYIITCLSYFAVIQYIKALNRQTFRAFMIQSKHRKLLLLISFNIMYS